MSDAPVYAHQTSPLARARLGRKAVRIRLDIRGERAPRDAQEDRKQRAMDRNRVIVVARWAGRMVFDVVKILGPHKAEPYALGCLWREEAIELAADCLLGRVTVAMHGGRTAFGGQAGGLWVPERAQRRAAHDFVQLVAAGPNAFEVQIAPKAKPPLSVKP